MVLSAMLKGIAWFRSSEFRKPIRTANNCQGDFKVTRRKRRKLICLRSSIDLRATEGLCKMNGFAEGKPSRKVGFCRDLDKREQESCCRTALEKVSQPDANRHLPPQKVSAIKPALCSFNFAAQNQLVLSVCFQTIEQLQQSEPSRRSHGLISECIAFKVAHPWGLREADDKTTQIFAWTAQVCCPSWRGRYK